MSRGGDASHFLFMNKEDENVTLDVKGRGVCIFFGPITGMAALAFYDGWSGSCSKGDGH